MAVFGMSAGRLALFVGFGRLIGVLFGFSGMGGSFLVTPALIVMGCDETFTAADIAGGVQRLGNDWYAKLGQLIAEFEEPDEGPPAAED